MAGFEALFTGVRPSDYDMRVAPNIAMSSDAPEDANLLNLYRELRNGTYARFLMDMVEDERYYLEEFGADMIPQEWQARDFKPTVPPTAYNAIESAANHILTTPDIMVPERPTETNYADEQAIAALKASALLFFWHQVFKQGDPLGHAKKDVIKWGKICLKVVLDYDNIEAANSTPVGRTQFPWCVYNISPSQVFEDPNNPYDPEFVFEAYETTREAAETTYPTAGGAWKLKKAWEKVRVLEYWEKPSGTSKGARKVWIDDYRVLNKPNPYYWVTSIKDNGKDQYDGVVPYFIGDSGWGDGDIGAAPHERYVGLLRRVHSVLETEARQVTMADAQLRISTFPLISLKGIEEDAEQPIKIGPGGKIHIDDTQEIKVVEWPTLDPAQERLLNRVHNYTNELTQFQILSGTPQVGVDSATEADQNFRSASAKLSGPISAIKSIITRVNEYVLICIEKILEEPVTLYGAMDGAPGAVTLTPEWINGFYENFVELKTSDERALDSANAVRWANLFQTFQLDRKFAMKMAGIPNPQQRIAQRMMEDVMLDPQMHQVRVAMEMQNQIPGELGQTLSMNALQQMFNGMPPTQQAQPAGQPPTVEPMAQSTGMAPMMQPPGAAPGAGGNFPGGGLQAMGQGQNPYENIGMPEGVPIQRNAARAIGFNRAMMARPDLQFGGLG